MRLSGPSRRPPSWASATIVPLAAARSEKALLAAAEKRAERWKKILGGGLAAVAAGARAGCLRRCNHPEQAFPPRDPGPRIMLSERIDAPRLRERSCPAQAPDGQAALAIGPEGGWTEEEFESALAPVSRKRRWAS